LEVLSRREAVVSARHRVKGPGHKREGKPSSFVIYSRRSDDGEIGKRDCDATLPSAARKKFRRHGNFVKMVRVVFDMIFRKERYYGVRRFRYRR